MTSALSRFSLHCVCNMPNTKCRKFLHMKNKKWTVRLVGQSKHLIYLSKTSMLPHFYIHFCCWCAWSARLHRSRSPWWNHRQYARCTRYTNSHFLGKLLALHRQRDKLPLLLLRFKNCLYKVEAWMNNAVARYVPSAKATVNKMKKHLLVNICAYIHTLISCVL